MTMTGARQLTARLDAVAKVPPTLLDRLGLLIVRGAKQRVARKTGQTGRTIRIASRSKSHVKVTAGGAALLLEGGTKPHIILPRKAKALRWGATAADRRLSGRPRKGGNVLFARRVNHPGTRAQPFMAPSVKDALAQSPLAGAVVAAWNSGA